MNNEYISECLCCGSTKLVKVISLKACPLSDSYQNTKEESLSMQNYTCDALFCTACSHLQLSSHVEPLESYTQYQYNSKITLGLNESFDNYAKEVRDIITDRTPSKNYKHLDVGSNDGSFLKACRDRNIDSFGIEPAINLMETANFNGLPTHCGYFDEDNIKRFESSFPNKYNIITFNNVLANIAEPLSALLLAEKMMKDKQSIIVVQTGYHPEQFAKGLFDYIYHEHYSYFTIKSISELAKRAGLNIFRYSISNLRGGTIRFYLEKKQTIDLEVSALTPEYERFDCVNEYNGLSTLIESSRQYIHQRLRAYKKAGKNIIGFGASHSTGMLVHTLDLSQYLDFLIDENEKKIGMFMPGTSLKVERLGDVNLEEYLVVVLAWQYFETIKTKLIRLGMSSNNIIRPVLP